MWKYLNFLWKSTNQHGVHSPFVFQYITKGVYQYKHQYKDCTPSQQWLLSTLDYFQPKSVYWNEETFEKTLSAWQVVRVENEQNADVIIKTTYDHVSISSLLQTLSLLKEEQLLLIVNDSYSKSLLDQIRADESVIVVVDFYYGVLISKRKEQLKQNFYIRL